MRTSLRMWLAVFVVVLVPPFARGFFAESQAPSTPEIPVAKGGAGSCSADFVVRDSAGKGVYDAKIGIQVQYGFFGARKLGLTIGTNYEGKARMEGLPEKIKNPSEFKITHAGQNKSVPFDPLTNCHSQNEVTLAEGQGTR
jgi:hypothetical protein